MTTPATAKGRILIVDNDRGFRQTIAALLAQAGHTVLQAATGQEALTWLAGEPLDVMLLDAGLPGTNGLDMLGQVRVPAASPRVVVMTADDTPETLLTAIRRQADRYVRKPFAPAAILEVVEEILGASPAAELPIEVVSARPDWVELVAPCSLQVAERVQAFLMHLEADLPEAVRESVAQAFVELLRNAVEWGGKLDPTRTVRISFLRARRMLLYRIADPGEGFNIERLAHAAINNPADDPLKHTVIREEKGLRPGGLGLAITRSLVDELIYNEARNEVVFIKYLD